MLGQYPRLADLIAAPRLWFRGRESPGKVLAALTPDQPIGIYCLWWRDRLALRAPVAVALSSGKRGMQRVSLGLWTSDSLENVPVYVGKGNIRNRISSHLKRSPTGRNPYSWVELLFPDQDPEALMRENMGFSYIAEPNPLEQVYTENLAIGVLRPWFNLRLTA